MSEGVKSASVVYCYNSFNCFVIRWVWIHVWTSTSTCEKLHLQVWYFSNVHKIHVIKGEVETSFHLVDWSCWTQVYFTVM